MLAVIRGVALFAQAGKARPSLLGGAIIYGDEGGAHHRNNTPQTPRCKKYEIESVVRRGVLKGGDF